ncbi:MAG: cation:proton antiporter [Nanoarchaeota archaeon]|nr:cation:proton antiporter [Nanoarchaeota archaeon]
MLGLINGEPINLFFSIGLIIILATFLGYLAKLIRQPLIPAYITAGVILGPLGLGLIHDEEAIKSLSEIGIAFLLFIVGLEIDLKKLKTVSLVSTFGGILQVALTFIFGFLIAVFLGFNQITAIYVGLIVAFSSTMVVIKLLSDKEELDTLHGRIVLGILIIQDLLVILALSLLTTFLSFSYFVLISAIGKGLILLAISILVSKYILPPFFKFAAKSQELFILLAISVCFSFSLLAYVMGFSIVIGAFIAGVGLASLPYSIDIIGRVMSLKDFFSTIFFISLGMQLVMIGKNMIIPLIVLIVFVVLLKPLIVMSLTTFFGYERRTSFLASISLGQVSEFSLVMVTLGYYQLAHVTQEFFSMIVLLTVITITLTSYFIKHDNLIYKKLSNSLKIFEKLSMDRKRLAYKRRDHKTQIVIFGCDRMGHIFLDALKKLHKSLTVVDFNPEIIDNLVKKKISCLYGDIMNTEVLDRLKLENVKMIISTVPKEMDNEFLIEYAKAKNPKVNIFVTSNHVQQALDLYEAGADYVILPHVIGGQKVSGFLVSVVKGKKDLKEIRKRHLKTLLNLERIPSS